MDKYIKNCLSSVSNLVDENVRLEACNTIIELLVSIQESKQEN
jgi:hypothetical protein